MIQIHYVNLEKVVTNRLTVTITSSQYYRDYLSVFYMHKSHKHNGF